MGGGGGGGGGVSVNITHQVDANWLYVDFRWMATMRECCLTSAPVSGVRSACAAGRLSSSLTRWMLTGSMLISDGWLLCASAV